LGKVFNNSWSFKSVKESSLSNVKVHKCYRRLLKSDVVTTIFREMPDLKPFLLWLVRNQSVVNYCKLCNDFPEEGCPETEERPSAQTRFNKLVEYTNNNVDSLTLEEVLTLIKNRNYRGRKSQEEENDMDETSTSTTSSPHLSHSLSPLNSYNNDNTQNESYYTNNNNPNNNPNLVNNNNNYPSFNTNNNQYNNQYNQNQNQIKIIIIIIM